MTQPAGNIFGFPSLNREIGLRVSPLVCACDALHFLVYLTRHSISTGSLREAMRLTLKARYQNYNTGQRNSAMILQQNVVFRVLLFTLGSLPQVIKLFCMQGIPVTTTIASFYFGSFLILEIGVYFSSGMGQDLEADSRMTHSVLSGDSLGKSLEWKLRHGVVALGLILLLHPFALSAYEIAKLIGCRLWPYGCGLSILALLPVIDTVWLKGERVSLTEIIILFPAAIGTFLSSCLLLSISDRARTTDSPLSLGLWIGAGLLVMMGIGSNHMYWIKSMDRLDVQSREVGIGISLFMIFYYLGTALLYYAFRYDPTGTTKPLWVGQLG